MGDSAMAYQYFIVLLILGAELLLAGPLQAGRYHLLPMTEKTIGYYSFEGNANDATGRGNHGKIEGASFTAGQPWQALAFNFNHAVRIPIPADNDITDEFTFEALIYPTGYRYIPMNVFTTSDGTISFTASGSGTLAFSILGQDGKQYTTRSEGEFGAIYLDKWQRVAGAFGNGFMAIYIDGHEVDRLELPGISVKKVNGDFILGNDRGMQSGFIGKMDEARITADFSPTLPVLDVLLTSYPSKGNVMVTANAVGAKMADSHFSATVQLLDGNGSVIETQNLGQFKIGIAHGMLKTGSLAEGEYPVVVRLSDNNVSTPLAEKTVLFRKLTDKPPWNGLVEKVTGKVPPPWTPPEVSGTDLICWGREYRYDKVSPFPAEIINQEQSILTRPISMTGKVNGQAIEWAPVENTIAGRTETAVTVESRTHSQRLGLAATTVFEYDGFMKIEIMITPEETAEVEDLRFEIPLKKEFARYYHYCPDSWTFEVRNAGSLPAEGWGNFFKPYLWLGNEDIGFAWCSETYRDWSIDKSKTAVEARPEGESVILRATIVNRPVHWSRPVKFVFGLQATPAKPRPAGSRIWRYGDGEGVTVGIKWADPKYGEWYHFPTPRDVDAYNAMIDSAFHSRGQKFTMYSDYYYPCVQLPEFQYYKGDWYVNSGCWAQSDVIFYGQPCLSVCMREKTWMDYHLSLFIDYWNRTKADGTYMDGVVPITCQNPTHEDCYFIDADGERAYDYQIFACREMLKAIYCVSRQYTPEKIVVSHMSTRMISPVLAFTDAYVDGEQFIAGERFNGDYIGSAPLDKIIAEFTGRQYGIVQFLLPMFRQEQRTEANFRNLLTILLLHDMSIWWGGSDDDVVHKVWKILDDFGIEDADFAPYWHGGEYGSDVRGENVLASAYYRKGREILLVVGNLGNMSTDAYISGDPKRFGIDSDVNIKDAFTGESIAVSGEYLTVTIPPKDFRLLRIRGH